MTHPRPQALVEDRGVIANWEDLDLGGDYDVLSRQSIQLAPWVKASVAILGTQEDTWILVDEAYYPSQAFFVAAVECRRRHRYFEAILTTKSIIDLLHQDPSLEEQTTISQEHTVLFNQMIGDAIRLGASDVSINQTDINQCEVLFDADTIRSHYSTLTRSQVEAMMRYFYQVMADQSTTQGTIYSASTSQFAAGDGVWSNRRTRIRYQSKPAHPSGTDYSLRLLNMSESGGFHHFDDLNITPDQLSLLENMARLASGAVLVAGVTNSGKTTTIKVILEEMRRRKPGLSIRTAESPPEYIIKGARQYTVKEGLDGSTDEFAKVIQELMRMNPDVIFVGEVRGAETASLFLKAAQSGHCVITTVHTSDTFSIVDRVVGEGLSQGVSKTTLCKPGVINGLVYQRRLPQLCDDCAQPAELSSEALARLQLVHADTSRIRQRSTSGCRRCNGRGVAGSIIAMEVTQPNVAMLKSIQTDDREGYDRAWLKLCEENDYGDAMETHAAHALRLLFEGQIELDTFENTFGLINRALLKAQCRTWDETHGLRIVR